MNAPDILANNLPFILLPAILFIALLFLLFKKRRQDTGRSRTCPHCMAAVGTSESECGSCHRKISYA